MQGAPSDSEDTTGDGSYIILISVDGQGRILVGVEGEGDAAQGPTGNSSAQSPGNGTTNAGSDDGSATAVAMTPARNIKDALTQALEIYKNNGQVSASSGDADFNAGFGGDSGAVNAGAGAAQ